MKEKDIRIHVHMSQTEEEQLLSRNILGAPGGIKVSAQGIHHHPHFHSRLRMPCKR